MTQISIKKCYSYKMFSYRPKSCNECNYQKVCHRNEGNISEMIKELENIFD